MEQYVTPEILQDGYKFSQSGVYIYPKVGPRDSYLEYISTIPLNSHPEVYGMHENAEIITQQIETRNTLSIILSVQPCSILKVVKLVSKCYRQRWVYQLYANRSWRIKERRKTILN